MKARLMACLLAATAAAAHGAPAAAEAGAVCRQAPRAWLGLKLEKPGGPVAAQVPDLPEGIGFLVTAVEAGGPAAAAGVREMDVLWKFQDQMLVNESQLAALLRLARPGEDVGLALFRGGRPLEVALTLGEAPARPAGKPAKACARPQAEHSAKCARYSADGEDAVVSRDGEFYQVRIHGPEGALVYDGRLGPDGGLEEVPPAWQRRVKVLCRTLDRALDGGLTAGKPPRPRVVPPAGAVP